MKLIKELYLIDRESLGKWHKSLTGDLYMSMKNGPVLSNVLDNINERISPDSYWNEHIARSGRYDIKLKVDSCPIDELSKRERELIDGIVDRFKDFNEWQIVDWCHENLPEWEKIDSGRAQIFIRDMLKAMGKTKEETEEIEAEISSFEFAKQAFSDE
jgi:hypothetical protein